MIEIFLFLSHAICSGLPSIARPHTHWSLSPIFSLLVLQIYFVILIYQFLSRGTTANSTHLHWLFEYINVSVFILPLCQTGIRSLSKVKVNMPGLRECLQYIYSWSLPCLCTAKCLYTNISFRLDCVCGSCSLS